MENSNQVENTTKAENTTKIDHSKTDHNMTDHATIEKQNYHSSITVDITPQKALECISRVSEWWATHFEGHSQKTGDVFTVRFGETFATFIITEVVAEKKTVWKVTDCNIPSLADKKEWKDMVIDWELSPIGHATRIDFTHIGLVPEVECYDMCVQGWSFYVKESLFKFITEGKGLPDTPRSLRN